ncbi:bifunctional riboflavin kinase/FAD synthetase [Oscillatoriales cyanobacterium LEGE 11467]|uniref:Riboflavin biosynthesis protein n=1 Tax=Zarconia navalis LEGE 11467 TaxID=1828826 RepID=A0A928VU74_9CYAN|nr:bifunctional riboflavin kinase/FAD synthetase [Zarconia navalis]MBE9040236.1 bifunctional riboflavin kinase/FAD synthetase [Zarconia navalis LEGE 11467]
MWVTSYSTTALMPTSVALGNFDGVHRGHQQVIDRVFSSASATIAPETPPNPNSSPSLPILGSETELPLQLTQERPRDRNFGKICTAVVTFNPHPQEFFSRQPRTYLTTLDEKEDRIRALGVDWLVLLPFDGQLAQLSPQAFVEEILVRQLNARQVSVGQDFRFGCQRVGTATDLQAIAANYGIVTNIVSLEMQAGERISSSSIRASLSEGRISRANRLLGYAYRLTGTVEKGQQLGRTLGFPTANLNIPVEKYLPRWGVYSVRVDTPNVTGHPGVMNIGCRPTVKGERPTVEVHLLEWSQDLYGQTVTVHLQDFLRPEQKFESLDALKAQIQKDCDRAKSELAS